MHKQNTKADTWMVEDALSERINQKNNHCKFIKKETGSCYIFQCSSEVHINLQWLCGVRSVLMVIEHSYVGVSFLQP